MTIANEDFADVCHTLPNRMRIRVKPGVHRQNCINYLKTELKKDKQIRSIDCKDSTGSIVVYFPENHKNMLLERLAQKEQDPNHSASYRKKVLEAIKDTKNSANQLLKSSTDGKIDLPLICGAALASLALIQYKRGIFLPAGLTLVLLAFRIVSIDDHEQ